MLYAGNVMPTSMEKKVLLILSISVAALEYYFIDVHLTPDNAPETRVTCHQTRANELLVIFDPYTATSQRDAVFAMLGNEKPEFLGGNSYYFPTFREEGVSSTRALPYILYAATPPQTCNL